MKKQILTIVILTLVFSIGAVAQDHRHNLSGNPVANILKFSNIEYSYKLTNQLTLGVHASSGKIDVGDVELKGISFGLVTRFYFEPAFQNDSWYLVGNVSSVNHEGSIESGGAVYSGEQNQTIVEAGGGYHWFWKSFNVNLGMTISNEDKVELKDPVGNKYSGEVNNNIGGEFNIGWKF